MPDERDPAGPNHAAEPPVEMIDWDLAITTARRLIKPGPEVTRAEAQQVVSDLRRFAKQAEGHVREHTGLHAESSSAPVLVVDRLGWVQANADGFREVLRPLVAKMSERRGGEISGVAAAIGSRVTGLEAGGLLAFLSNKVLGQFDPFYTGPAGGAPTHGGRLLLVAPNVVHVERELGVDPQDFRLWVCLHEETHRVQFTAVPWLREHLLGQIAALLESTDLDPQHLAALMRDGIERIGRLVKGDKDVSIIDVLQSPEQRETVERITAIMSLLEGHADVVMDGVGPGVVPTVATIRSKFEGRRAGAGPIDQTIRRLLGLDAKLRQYRDGAAFVRGAVDKVGQDGFNAVWFEPAHLPSKGEIADPAAWVRRVHG